MKNIVKFNLFGDENDYLCYGLKELMELEKLTDTGSIRAVIAVFATGDFSINFILSVLKIGLKRCYKEFGKDLQKVDDLFESAIGDYSLQDFADKVFEGIVASGILPKSKKENPT